MGLLDTRKSDVLALLRRHGPLSRHDLYQRLQLRPNTFGEIAESMIEQGLLCDADPGGPGRAGPGLQINPVGPRVVGLALGQGKVSLSQLNLLGRPVVPTLERSVKNAAQLIPAATELMAQADVPGALVLGVSATGFVDAQSRSMFTSSATMTRDPTRLDAIYAAAGACPILMENDMHARAAHWMLMRDAESPEDVLLVDMRDGAIGAALLVNGLPNRGCIIGANELGHTRLPVETDVCYCGHTGCLERICSSHFLRRVSGDPKTRLYERIEHFGPDDEPVSQIRTYLAMAIANAINFIRPNRVALTGRMVDYLPFANRLLREIRSQLLAPLAERVRIDPWEKLSLDSADFAGWLGLAAVYRKGWEVDVARPTLAP